MSNSMVSLNTENIWHCEPIFERLRALGAYPPPIQTPMLDCSASAENGRKLEEALRLLYRTQRDTAALMEEYHATLYIVKNFIYYCIFMFVLVFLCSSNCWFLRKIWYVISFFMKSFIYILRIVFGSIGCFFMLLAGSPKKGWVQLKSVASWWKRRKVRMDLASGKTPVLEEKMNPGSDLIPSLDKPRNQVELLIEDGGKVYHRGEAFRYGNFLLTAKHNIPIEGSNEEIWFSVKDKAPVHVPISDFKSVEGVDLTWASVSPNDWSRLGVATTSFALPVTTKQVATVFSGGKKTMGSVLRYKSYMNTYMGSTLQGWSGAPVIVGNQVVGMHIGVHSHNTMIDGAFIKSLVNKHTQEDSEDYLIEQAIGSVQKSGKKIRMIRTNAMTYAFEYRDRWFFLDHDDVDWSYYDHVDDEELYAKYRNAPEEDEPSYAGGRKIRRNNDDFYPEKAVLPKNYQGEPSQKVPNVTAEENLSSNGLTENAPNQSVNPPISSDPPSQAPLKLSATIGPEQTLALRSFLSQLTAVLLNVPELMPDQQAKLLNELSQLLQNTSVTCDSSPQ